MKPKITGEGIDADVQLSLLYVKFKNLATTSRGLISEIEQRCGVHPEYFSLLRDCINTYTNIRKSILIPVISENVKLKSNSGNNLQYVFFELKKRLLGHVHIYWECVEMN
jgi:hypothetical protein